MNWRRIAMAAGLLALAATEHGHAGITDTAGGTIPPGNNAVGVASQVEANWNAGDDYACSRTADSLTVTVSPTSLNAGACSGQALRSTYRITGGPNAPLTSVAHPFAYNVTCTAQGRLQHSIGFDENTGNPTVLLPGTTVFVIDGGSGPSFLGAPDVLEIESLEFGVPTVAADNAAPVAIGPIPTLGEWGGLVLMLVVTGCGVLLILRRS